MFLLGYLPKPFKVLQKSEVLKKTKLIMFSLLAESKLVLPHDCSATRVLVTIKHHVEIAS